MDELMKLQRKQEICSLNELEIENGFLTQEC